MPDEDKAFNGSLIFTWEFDNVPAHSTERVEREGVSGTVHERKNSNLVPRVFSAPPPSQGKRPGNEVVNSRFSENEIS